MSAIVGVFYPGGRSVDGMDLQRMVDIQAHRGPHGSDVWCRGSVGLGHRLLWTTAESRLEKLPLVNQRGDLAITADARIDNRDELIAAFGYDTHPPSQITDSQLILAAYDKWEEQCPEHLLGDFAFAIWDDRRQRLFCARDHFGVKPFYYYASDQIFVCASEIKALFCLADVPYQLNEMRVGDYLVSLFEDTAITFYQGILRLPPAHRLTVSCQGIQLQPYWSLDPHDELRLGSDAEYAGRFREIFAEAVRCRLRSAFPVGSMLSGGLDSSSIACMARKILTENGRQPLPTFSAVFDDVTECDERPYINAVLAQGGMEPHYVQGDKLSPLIDLEQVLWHQDEPLYAFNLCLTWSLYRVAQRQGVRVILDGFDGDSTVSHGVGYLKDLAQAGKWLTLYQQLRGYTKHFGYPFPGLFWALLWRYEFSRFRALRFGHRVWHGVRRRVWKPDQPSATPAWDATLNADFVERIGLKERRRVLNQAAAASKQSQRAEHHYHLVRGVMPYTLEVMDKAAAAFGMELRFPFWDKRLVEFCLSLPAEQKIHRGWTRMVMRRALAGILPEDVQWRGGKSNLGPSFTHGFLTFEHERLQEVLFHHPELIETYTDITALREAYDRFVSRDAHDDDEIAVWRAVTLALWLKKQNLKHQT